MLYIGSSMKIYALVCEQLVLYVGKTNQTLEKRAMGHRTPTSNSTSKYIPDWMGWEIILLEEVPDEKGTTKEQHYYDTLKPLYNRQRPGQSHEEWEQTEAGKESNRTRSSRYNSSDHGKEARKDYASTEEFRQRRSELRNTEESRQQRMEYQRQYRARKKAILSQ
jgi:hypothetical protein